MANEILIPVVGVIGLVGLLYAKLRGGNTGQGSATPQAGGVPPSFASAPTGVPLTALPTNVPLSFQQVHALASRMIAAHGFLCEPAELVATAYIESSFRPWVYRNERRGDGSIWDTSYGLMQTLLGTAQDMYSKGYRGAGVPSSTMLLKPEVSMYFGAAYKDWLKRNYKGRSAEWHVRAYNGGAGWEKTQNGPANTAVYYQRFLKAFASFYG